MQAEQREASHWKRDPGPTPDEGLTSVERHELERFEKAITEGETLLRRSFVLIGEAFEAIFKGRLYREQFPNVHEYCVQRWNIQESHAYRLIRCAKVIRNLSDFSVIPANVEQARHIAIIKDPEIQRDAWRETVASAPEGKITERHVRTVVERFLPDLEPINRNAIRSEPPPPEVAVESLVYLMDALNDAREAGWKPAETILKRNVPDTLTALAGYVRRQAALALRLRHEE